MRSVLMAPVAVLRPEPGNAATAARLAAAGLTPVRLPLFAVRPLGWSPPDPAAFDALLLTSANAVRHAGPGLARLAGLPVWAVGEATAAAARAAGLSVAGVGTRDAAALVAQLPGPTLHLCGADTTLPPGAVAASVPVYASEPVPVPPDAIRALAGGVALLHSARAAGRWGTLVDAAGVPRAAVAIAALSPAVLAAAGEGWAAGATAAVPTDRALVAAAATLIDRAAARGDKMGT